MVIFSGSDLADQIAQGPVGGYVVKGSNLEVLLQEIHTATLPSVAAYLPLEPDPTAARAARRFLHEYCSAWGRDGITDTAELVVSELVTNAIVHARAASVLRLRIGDGHLRVELLDRAPTAASTRTPPGSWCGPARRRLTSSKLRPTVGRQCCNRTHQRPPLTGRSRGILRCVGRPSSCSHLGGRDPA